MTVDFLRSLMYCRQLKTLYIARFLVDFLLGVQNPKNPTIHVQNTVDFLRSVNGCYCELNLYIARFLVDFLSCS